MGIPMYAADFEGQYPWIQIGTITSAQADLGVDARDNASVVALADTKKVIFSADDGTPAFIVRLRVDGSNNDACALHLYGAKGADYYQKIGDIATTQGQQDWSGGHFVDTIVITNEDWQPGIRVDSPAGDRVAAIFVNTGGFDRFLFIASTIAAGTTTIHVDIARLDKKISGDIYSAIVTLTGGVAVDVSDVVSAIHDEGDNQITEISDAASNVKSAVDDIATAVTGVRSGILSAATEEQSILHSMLDDTSAIVDQTTTVANNTDSAVDAIDEVKTEVSDAISNLKSATLVGLDRTSTAGGTQVLTIAANVAVGSAQVCRTCLIHVPATNGGNVHLTIEGAAADANDFLIPQGQVIPVPVDDCSDLSFYGANNGDVIYVMWRN